MSFIVKNDLNDNRTGEDFLDNILENAYQISGVILLICGVYFYWHFKKLKKQNKLTSSERAVYIITRIAMFVFAGSYFLLFLNNS